MPSNAQLLDRYLALLAVTARRPSVEALAELTAAHLARIPFENISKLFYRHVATRCALPILSQFLDGIEQHRFGGTCYSNSYHFHQLLTHLGYTVALCGADMSAPNVHLVNVVTLDEARYLVDVGYGAPLRAPLPLDATADNDIRWGPFRYVLRPRDAEGRSRLDTYRHGVLSHGYTVTPTPRRIEDFAAVIAQSYADDATFMHALLIARYGVQRSVMLRNLTLYMQDGSERRTSAIPSPEALPDVIEREFGLPSDIVRQALDGVQLTKQP